MLWNLLFILQPPPQSSDFFSSSIWQFLGGISAFVAVPIAILATFIAILTYRQQQQRKEFAYQIISNAPIVSVNKSLENRVKVLLDSKEVKDTRLLVIKIWNSGNQSIKPKDYFEPINFHFVNGTVVSSEVLETNPQTLLNLARKTLLKPSNTSIELSKFSLNPRDSITFSILLSGKSAMEQEGRLDEGQIIDYREHLSKNLGRSHKYALILSGLLVVVSTSQLFILSQTKYNNLAFIICQIVFFSIVAIYIYNFSKRQKYMKSLGKKNRKY